MEDGGNLRYLEELSCFGVSKAHWEAVQLPWVYPSRCDEQQAYALNRDRVCECLLRNALVCVGSQAMARFLVAVSIVNFARRFLGHKICFVAGKVDTLRQQQAAIRHLNMGILTEDQMSILSSADSIRAKAWVWIQKKKRRRERFSSV